MIIATPLKNGELGTRVHHKEIEHDNPTGVFPPTPPVADTKSKHKENSALVNKSRQSDSAVLATGSR